MQFTSKNLYQSLNDAELLKQTHLAAKTEKAATLALLDYLVEVDARRLYTTVNACSSLFEYLVKELGLSPPAASERVNAVRLIRAVPPVKEHLQTGKLTLTSAAQIQRFVNTEQKVHPLGKAVSRDEKDKVIAACLGKSKREVEKTLCEKQSEPARVLTQQKVRVVTATRSEIKFTVGESTLEKLQQLKNLTGDTSLERIFDQGLAALLLAERKKRGVIPRKSEVKTKAAITEAAFTKDTSPEAAVTEAASTQSLTTGLAVSLAAAATTPRRQPADLRRTPARGADGGSDAQLHSRFIQIDLKRFVFARSKGRCEFMDSRSKVRCRATFRLQIDHALPRALGGKTEASNLRHLCSAHNLRLAKEAGLHGSNRPPFYQ
jgi:5-methylcytosine-specific restriction endonuclease McrA